MDTQTATIAIFKGKREMHRDSRNQLLASPQDSGLYNDVVKAIKLIRSVSSYNKPIKESLASEAMPTHCLVFSLENI